MMKSYLAYGSVLTGLMLSSAAAAQQAEQELGSTTAEIIVTAQKREQSLGDVPIAIQAFSGASLEAQGVRAAVDILNQVPSASVQSATPTQAVLQLRGISQNPAVDPSVAVYLDEIPLGFPGQPFMPNIEALDLKRIEVLRGPQGTLYGQGAMGGTVRVITADPDLTGGFSGNALLEGSTTKGGDQSYLASGALNVPLVEDKLAARINVSYRKLGGWLDIPGRGVNNVNDDKVFNVRAKLLFAPTDRLRIKLTYIRSEIDTLWTNLASLKNSDVFLGTGLATDPAAFQNTHYSIYGGFVSYDLGFATLENGLSYYDSKTPARFVIGTGLGTLLFDTADKDTALTNELRLVSNGNDALQYILGIYYRDSSRRFDQLGAIGPIVIAPNSINKVDSTSYSIFGELSYGFAADKVRVLVGARYFRDRRDYFETLEPVPGTIITTLDLQPKFHSFNPRFNVTVKPSEGVMLYANVAKGFRSGIVNNAAQTNAAALDGITGIQVVQPDSIWTYEVGGKLSLADRSLFLEGALFYSDWSNFQLAGTSSIGFGFNINGGNARIKGIEGSLNWNTPLKGLSLSLNGSYVSSKFKSVSPILAPHALAFVVGRQLPSIPKWSGSISANYVTPISSNLDFVGGGTFIFKDGSTDSTGQLIGGLPFGVDSRSELSLRAGVKTANWDITAFADNLTNNKKSIVSLTPAGWFSPRPRTLGIRFGARF
jgi:outer membrane receptor protein involved in Fe transport